MSGICYAVGIGPGNISFMTKECIDVLNSVDIIIGYKTYTNIIKKYFPQKNIIESTMREEISRCNEALMLAREGKSVAVISSGDSGIYGMAGLLFEVNEKNKFNVEIRIVCGITAATFAAQMAGAPLMCDFAVISLSDLLIPLDRILKRVEAAAAGDFVICIYNPKSKKRVDHLKKAANIIKKYRSKNTICAICKNAGREGENMKLTVLENLENEDVDMLSTVIIGNSFTTEIGGKMVTRRGYENKN